MKDPKGRSKVSLFSRILQRLDIYEKGKGWHSLRVLLLPDEEEGKS